MKKPDADKRVVGSYCGSCAFEIRLEYLLASLNRIGRGRTKGFCSLGGEGDSMGIIGNLTPQQIQSFHSDGMQIYVHVFFRCFFGLEEL